MSSMGTTGSTVDGEKGVKNGAAVPPPSSHLLITVLRLLTFAATLAAFVTMITNKQKDPIYGWSKYHYSDAFLFFVVANCIAFIYALLAAIIGAFSKSSIVTKHLVVLDLLVSYLIIAAGAAATAVAYIGKNGLDKAGWQEICSIFDRYCHHVAGALVANFLGWLFLTIAIFLGMRRRA